MALDFGRVSVAISTLFSLYKFRELVHHADGNSSDCHTLQNRIHIEQPNRPEAAPLEGGVIRQRLSEISRSDNHHVVYSVQAKDLADFIMKVPYIISVALLSESAEIIQILTDL